MPAEAETVPREALERGGTHKKHRIEGTTQGAPERGGHARNTRARGAAIPSVCVGRERMGVRRDDKMFFMVMGVVGAGPSC